jgi:hypothetical protein
MWARTPGLVVALVAALLLAAPGASANAAQHLQQHSSTLAQEQTVAIRVHQLHGTIRYHRHWTWYWQRKAKLHRTQSNYAERGPHSLAYLGYVAHYWYRTHYAAKRHALAVLRRQAQAAYTYKGTAVPALFYHQALCVHGGEGAWDAIGPKGAATKTFGGGLQFMLGTWNGAARASGGRVRVATSIYDIATRRPVEQIYAAYVIVVLEHDGWGQWPNTARACGLL